uniref:Uncharacterized protein n=1 Tax=Anguilla anguilla TaxID=7936 RepID=A0A0E9SQ74_ANGAN
MCHLKPYEHCSSVMDLCILMGKTFSIPDGCSIYC